MHITNKNNVSLPLAVWLIDDNYDYNQDPTYISVTKLMRPLKHLVLPPRIMPTERPVPDVEDYIARALGHSLHDSIEKAWVKNYRRSLELLGYPAGIIDRVQINPADDELTEDSIPVYIEQRAVREFANRKIGGKYDMVAEGAVNDNKSTSAFTWLYGGRDDEHKLQGSLYRWIDAAQPVPKITEDYIRINYIFTDWQKTAARTNPKYPQTRVAHKDIPLMTLQETEDWVSWKLAMIEKYRNAREADIPDCTDEELWMSEPSHKYYSDPSKTSGRSTKNFTDLAEANLHRANAGKGIVITVPGEAKRCAYCEAFPICEQKNRYAQP